MSTRTLGSTENQSLERARWRVDPTRSEVQFEAPHFFGLVNVKGAFARYSGRVDLSAEPAVELTIDAASLDTKNPRRDTHLRSTDFFDAAAHPHIRFVSESATLDGERLQVRGRLHAAGASVVLEVDARFRRVGDEAEVDAITYIDQRQLGMTWNFLRMIRSPSKLIVHVRLVRDAGAS
jgi:polyisoprenoid-binding protein YceI